MLTLSEGAYTAETRATGTITLTGASGSINTVPVDGFDILGDGGTGTLNEAHPVAAVEVARAGQTDFETALARPGVSVRLAVRPRRARRAGPIGPTIFGPLSAPPAPAQLL